MTTAIVPKINPRCSECNSPVKIIVRPDVLGNAHGEIWICPIHGEDVKEIIID